MAKIRVFLTDDHTLFRQGIRTLLAAEPDLEVVGESANANDAVERTVELRPDVVLLDISMPGMSSFQAIRDRSFSKGKTRLAARRVELVPEFLLVTARHQPGARRRTVWRRDVAAGEPHARFCQRVNVRRGNIFTTMNPDIRVAHVVANDEQDVWLFRFGGGRDVESEREPKT